MSCFLFRTTEHFSANARTGYAFNREDDISESQKHLSRCSGNNVATRLSHTSESSIKDVTNLVREIALRATPPVRSVIEVRRPLTRYEPSRRFILTLPIWHYIIPQIERLFLTPS